ncbi:MAG TPA: ABC transporter permease [Alphaproteobacteria bacterium]|nr:ABC transporter permease [Alphaproteobacteria bacterium]
MAQAATIGRAAGRVSVERADARAGGAVRISLSGDWQFARGLEPLGPVRAALASGAAGGKVRVEAEGLGRWDSSLIAFLVDLQESCARAGLELDLAGLPEGVKRLLDLATAVPERTGTGRDARRVPFLEAVGRFAQTKAADARRSIEFLGAIAIALAKLVTGRASFRASDLFLYMQECGAQALPIVTVISILIGLILAFVGSVQLKQFGADIYVADLVAVATMREMAAVMTAIVLAGRTGAAYAAQLGTMQGNEEIDALTALGISPIEFLVLPRVVALMLMMPLLCVYANLMGILGGLIVGSSLLDVTTTGYLVETQHAASLTNFWIGISKSAVFGAIVAFAGCLKGMNAGRSAAAVGDATTGAVVMGILYIIVADGIFSVVLNVLGI